MINPHPTWNIKDSSKLEAYQRCNRYYFYKYILGWDMDVPAHDLVFGEAYHRGREVQMDLGYDKVAEAYEAFEAYYRPEFPHETDAIYRPKDGPGALNAFMQLAQHHTLDMIENEVIVLNGKKMLEIAGTVPVAEDRALYYRLDSIMKRVADGKIFSWDHKTTSERYINGRQWADQFYLSLQNGTYTHCLFCIFPIEDVLGMEFYGTGFAFLSRGSANRPAGHHCNFRKVPAYKTSDQMNAWLYTVNALLDDIERDMDRLYSCSENDPVMQAFKMNGSSCTDYRGCEFHDFCLAWQNPLQHCYEPPLGFTEKFWDPSERESNVKLDLEMKVE